MKIKEHDFVEIDYTGKLLDETVFDTTLGKVAQENGLSDGKRKFIPLKICVGERQLLPGLDKALVGKEVGKEYIVNLPVEEAFGKRDIKKMRIVPASTFREHKIDPQPGLQVDVDGQMGIITRVSGGRIIVNFNHPLAGKEVIYTFKVNSLIEDLKEKIISYLTVSLNIPEAMFKVEVKDDKAEIKLPFELPEQATTILANKLKEIVKLKEVNFGKQEIKKEVTKQASKQPTSTQ